MSLSCFSTLLIKASVITGNFEGEYWSNCFPVEMKRKATNYSSIHISMSVGRCDSYFSTSTLPMLEFSIIEHSENKNITNLEYEVGPGVLEFGVPQASP